MKTKEELTALKEEVATLNEKLAELSEEELAEVAGGAKPNPEEMLGEVVGILPNAKYRVKLIQAEFEVEAYLSGKLRAAGLSLIAGDKVVVKLSICAPTTGRIIDLIK